MKNSYSEKTLTKNSFLRVFKKFILRIILYLNQKKLVQDIFKSELNIKEVIIKESSKPIIDILYINNKPNIKTNIDIKSKIKFIKTMNERRVDLITYCLLQFKGLIRYLHFNGVSKDDIRKISHYITYKKKKKGEYLFRMNERTNALFGLLKGKNEIRHFNTFDYTNKFQIEIKDNFPDNKFHQKIPFEYFMSDCEDDGLESSSEESEDESKNKEIEKEDDYKLLNSEEERKYLEALSKLTEEDIDNVIDDKIINEKRKKIDLKIKFKKKKKIKIKKKKTIKYNIIKRLRNPQTPNLYNGNTFNKYLLYKFILEFENIENEILEGECFGESNLISKNNINKSIYCVEDCDYFLLNKEYFDKILAKRFLKSHSNKVRFIANKFPIFKKEMKTSNLLNQVIPINFEKETLVYSPFDKADNLYLVYQGECNLFLIDNAKCKDDYFHSNKKKKVISKLLVGGIAGYESCLNGNHNYEHALIVKKPYTVLFKINVNYVNHIYKGFKKSIFPLYQKQKFIFDELSKINDDIKKNLSIGKEKIHHQNKNEFYDIHLEKKKKVYSNDKHLSKIFLNTENNYNQSIEKKKNELINVRAFKSIKIPINNINNIKINNKGNLYNVRKMNLSSKNFLFEKNNKKLIHSRNIIPNQSTTSFFRNYSTSTMNKTENNKTENNKTETSELKVMNSYSNILKPKLNVSNLKLKKINKKKANINDIFKNYKSGLFTLPFVTRLIKND